MTQLQRPKAPWTGGQRQREKESKVCSAVCGERRGRPSDNDREEEREGERRGCRLWWSEVILGRMKGRRGRRRRRRSGPGHFSKAVCYRRHRPTLGLFMTGDFLWPIKRLLALLLKRISQSEFLFRQNPPAKCRTSLQAALMSPLVLWTSASGVIRRTQYLSTREERQLFPRERKAATRLDMMSISS